MCDLRDEGRRVPVAVLLVMLAIALLAGCGGPSASTADRTTSTRAVSPSTTVPPQRLAAGVAGRIELVCHHGETHEDQNVIVSFANDGVMNFSPSVVAALRVASAHVADEAKEVSVAVARQGASAGALTEDMGSEAELLDRSAHAIQLSSDQTALLSVLHRRIRDADNAGVPSCGGVQFPSMLRAAPPPP
jgi:hypothetical protein